MAPPFTVAPALEPPLVELTLRGIVLGALITIVFTAANVYLGLKIGLTFASSIPAAVISMAVLRMVRNATILENNMVQTLASSAGALSSIIFILPGMVISGQWAGFPYWQSAGIAAVGGMLGVMFTVPLRRAMVVESPLAYPEGVAAAAILRAGADGGGIREIIGGGIVAALLSLVSQGFKLLSEGASWFIPSGIGPLWIGSDFSLALMGGGFLVGFGGAAAMGIGVAIAWWLAVPILFHLGYADPSLDPGDAATLVWRHQVRFMGAGTIATGAVWTLILLAGPVLAGMRSALGALAEQRAGRGHLIPRVERDIPIHLVGLIIALLCLPLGGLFFGFAASHDGVSWATATALTLAGVLFTVVFGFLIAAACGYMAGLVGSTNSPISGIGILGISLVSLLLVALFAGPDGVSAAGGNAFLIGFAIFVTSAVLAAATTANDNLQDLKTGVLVGATPWRQQTALCIGVVAGAVVIPPILQLLYQAYGFTGALPHPDMNPAQVLAAPQANLMTSLARGIIGHQAEWGMMSIGLALGLAIILVDLVLKRLRSRFSLPVLAVGLGIYLPPDTIAPIVLGGIIALVAVRSARARERRSGLPIGSLQERTIHVGTLIASGMIVGESLIGVALATIIVFSGSQTPLALLHPGQEALTDIVGAFVFVGLCAGYARLLAKH